MKLIWLLLAATVGTLAVHASDLDDKTKAFNAAVHAALPKEPNANPMSGGRFYPMVETPSTPEAENSAEQAVRQIMGLLPDAAAAQKAGQDLLDAIKAQRKARTEAFQEKTDALLGRIPAIVAKAEKPADLDQVLTDIQEAERGQHSSGYAGGEDYQSIVNRLNSTYQFVALWQDYLSQRGSGNLQEALNTLRNLQNQRGAGESLIPRSQILDRINDLQGKVTSSPTPSRPQGPDVGSILEGIKTLDDLPGAVRNIGSPGGYGETSDIAQLKHYAFMYEQAKNGLPISLESSPQNYGVMTPQPGFARIASMLYAYLLPRFLGSSAPAPNANEPTDDYLDRVIKSAETEHDWTLLQRAITAKIRISQNRSQNPGVQSFVAGINQEIAGQYALAVGSYQGALRQADDYTPAQVIGDRLAAIKKDHPSDYDEGMKRFLNPPAPNYVYSPYGQPGMYSPQGMPGVQRPSPVASKAAEPSKSPDASATETHKASPATTNSAPSSK